MSAAPDHDPVTIRRASLGDADVIERLARETWTVCFAGMITDAQIEHMLNQRYSPEALHSAISTGNPIYEILVCADAPEAFAAHGPAAGEAGSYKLHQLYVRPASQGRGFGGRLLEHVERLAREGGFKSLVLTVNRNNHRARSVYERRGFTIREARVFDIGNGFVMDDFVLEKRL